jgi:hypothetical protein
MKQKNTREFSMNEWTKLILSVGVAAAFPLVSQAQVNLQTLDRGMVGPRAQVLTLGTVHLRDGMPASFNPASLDGLRDRLAAFKPDIITVENRSGEECDLVARHPAKHGTPYHCGQTDVARAATGLDVPAAIAEVDKTLKAWPSQGTAATPAQRRRLAALFFAANDSASAYVQWLQLAPTERRAGDSLDAALVEMLDKIATLNDEVYQIAVPLAVRLGLQRIYATDDHTGDNLDVADEKAYGQAMNLAFAADADMQEKVKQTDALKLAPDLLPLYRYINDPAYQRTLTRGNITNLMRSTSPEGYPQMFVAGWEIRNLRMVANIRETFRERPGARVLTIVGASHKSLFDGWLGQLQGIDIVDAAVVLR